MNPTESAYQSLCASLVNLKHFYTHVANSVTSNVPYDNDNA